MPKQPKDDLSHSGLKSSVNQRKTDDQKRKIMLKIFRMYLDGIAIKKCLIHFNIGSINTFYSWIDKLGLQGKWTAIKNAREKQGDKAFVDDPELSLEHEQWKRKNLSSIRAKLEAILDMFKEGDVSLSRAIEDAGMIRAKFYKYINLPENQDLKEAKDIALAQRRAMRAEDTQAMVDEIVNKAAAKLNEMLEGWEEDKKTQTKVTKKVTDIDGNVIGEETTTTQKLDKTTKLPNAALLTLGLSMGGLDKSRANMPDAAQALDPQDLEIFNELEEAFQLGFGLDQSLRQLEEGEDDDL